MKFHRILPIVIFTLTLAGDSVSAAPEAKTEGERLVAELWANLYNPPQDLSVIDRVCAPDVVLTSSGNDIVGRDGFREWVKVFTSKIRDMRLENQDMFTSADGTRVVSRWKVTGFNRGVLGTPADDQPVEFTGIAIWQVRDGKLAHNWVERSAFELLQKLQKRAAPAARQQ